MRTHIGKLEQTIIGSFAERIASRFQVVGGNVCAWSFPALFGISSFIVSMDATASGSTWGNTAAIIWFVERPDLVFQNLLTARETQTFPEKGYLAALASRAR